MAVPTTTLSHSRHLSHLSHKSSQSLPTNVHHHSITVYHVLPFPTASQPSRTQLPEPLRTSHKPEDSRRQASQRDVSITLGAIAGTFLFGFLLAIFRCIYRYKRPPKRDRIAEVLQRHNLHCEMQELERNPFAFRRPSLREPAPPYFPRPPSYADSVVALEILHREENDSTSSLTRNLPLDSSHSPSLPTTMTNSLDDPAHIPSASIIQPRVA